MEHDQHALTKKNNALMIRMDRKREKNRLARGKMAKMAKMYVSPTGSKHKEGSSKHKYWMDIERAGKEQKKYKD